MTTIDVRGPVVVPTDRHDAPGPRLGATDTTD